MAPARNKSPSLPALLVVLAALSLAALGAKLFLDAKYYPPVLMYHNIEDLPAGTPLCVTGAQFRAQMKFLRDHKYNIVSLDELADIMDSGKPVPHNIAAVTFDDGNANNYLNALPVLKEFGIPATVFMVSDHIGRSGYLTVSQMRKMSDAGIGFGSHTKSHRNLKDASMQDTERELMHSKKIIEEVTGKKVTAFCYPSGQQGGCCRDVLKRAGYRTAFLTMPRDGSVKLDPYALKRINIETSKANLLEFRIKMSGYYTWLKAKRWKKK